MSCPAASVRPAPSLTSPPPSSPPLPSPPPPHRHRRHRLRRRRHRHHLASSHLAVPRLDHMLALATPPPSAGAKLIQCATSPSSPGCSIPPAPDVFDARFSFGSSGNATIRVTSSWAPLYANLFWQLISLGFYDESPPFRVDYRNGTHGFMAQMGWNLQEGVQVAWDAHRAMRSPKWSPPSSPTRAVG